MTSISQPHAPTASANPAGATPVTLRWSAARMIKLAIVILMGIAVGLVIGVVIGVMTGLIPIQMC